MFENIVWHSDRAQLGDLVFRLEHYRNESWELGAECFAFYKTAALMNQYEIAFSRWPSWRPRHMIELGMWDGGSLALWFECLRPEKLVGIDLAARRDSAYFERFVGSRQATDRIRTYWGADQTDRALLQRIVGQDLDGELNLVVDDASHLYATTKRSFEVLFPIMKPGGLYIVEDWAWAHWPAFQHPTHPWANERPLTDLVLELVQAVGTSDALIASLAVHQGFVIVERGAAPTSATAEFRLGDHISLRPAPSRTSLRAWLARKMAF